MPETKELYEAGSLALIANVGTLIEPVPNRAAFHQQQPPSSLRSVFPFRPANSLADFGPSN